MKINKCFFKKIREFFSKRIIIVCSLIITILIIISFLFLSLYGSWWRIWPKKLEAIIALNRLAVLVYNQPYCHEECYLEKTIYRSSILVNINQSNFFSKLSNIVFNENENLNWRIEIIKILSMAKLPADSNFITDINIYLRNDTGNLEIKKIFIFYFKDYLDQDNNANYFKNIYMNNLYSTTDKITTLHNLSLLDSDNNDFYLSILKNEKEMVILAETLRIIGANMSKSDLDQVVLVNSLENILRRTDASFTVRRLCVFILASFLENNQNTEVYKLFEKLVTSGEIDIFTRYLIIDIFNNYVLEKYELPVISEGDWNYYYQQQ
ncbi:MAG TPA: hypothetical protein PLE28_01515 [bacterium]|nr:hypothetical protein [bacterium]